MAMHNKTRLWHKEIDPAFSEIIKNHFALLEMALTTSQTKAIAVRKERSLGSKIKLLLPTLVVNSKEKT